MGKERLGTSGHSDWGGREDMGLALPVGPSGKDWAELEKTRVGSQSFSGHCVVGLHRHEGVGSWDHWFL